MTYIPGTMEQSEIHSMSSLNELSEHVTHCVSFGPQHPDELSHLQEQTRPSAAIIR